jgi:hypothetical protein
MDQKTVPVHYDKNAFKKGSNVMKLSPACGSKAKGLRGFSHCKDNVTCGKCLTKIDKQDAKRAKREEIKKAHVNYAKDLGKAYQILALAVSHLEDAEFGAEALDSYHDLYAYHEASGNLYGFRNDLEDKLDTLKDMINKENKILRA